MNATRTYRTDEHGGLPPGLMYDSAEVADDVPGSRNAEVYDRLAPFYDWLRAPLELMGSWRRLRARILAGAVGDVLEVGVGTGRNFGLYPHGVRLTAIDVSERMIERARLRAAKLNRSVDLWVADVESLPFEPASFDTVTATCVFSSVEDPLRGLQEVRRVLKSGGHVRLLEHVRPRGAVLGSVFDTLSPLSRRFLGAELNGDPERDVEAAGFEVLRVRREGLWKEIVARPAFRA